MRVVALDYGLARTGLAYAESERSAILPVCTIHARDFPKKALFFDALAEKIAGLQAEEVVMGMPLPAHGEDSLICRQIRNAAKRLLHRIKVPLFFVNEALSSEEAWESLSHVPKEKRREVLDQAAACVILRAYFAAPAERQPFTG